MLSFVPVVLQGEAMDVTTDQTVEGDKTFSDDVILSHLIGTGDRPVFTDSTGKLKAGIAYRSGIHSFVADGVIDSHSFAHGLDVTPSVVIVTRGNSTDFTVFATTWDATDVTLHYQLAPSAGTIALNWFATA